MKIDITATTYSPDTVEVLTLKAKLLNKSNKFDEAMEAINKCIGIVDPNSVNVILFACLLGYLFYLNNKLI